MIKVQVSYEDSTKNKVIDYTIKMNTLEECNQYISFLKSMPITFRDENPSETYILHSFSVSLFSRTGEINAINVSLIKISDLQKMLEPTDNVEIKGDNIIPFPSFNIPNSDGDGAA